MSRKSLRMLVLGLGVVAVGGALLPGRFVDQSATAASHAVNTELAAAAADPNSADVTGLVDFLRTGLRAYLPSELTFIDRSVHYVAIDRLPKPVVLSSYSYARKKRPNRPFPYFKYSMKIRAKKFGVDL